MALATIAGMINSVGLLSARHHAVSHVTGTATHFGIALAEGDAAGVVHLAVIVMAFLAGAMAAGAIVDGSVLRLGRRYGVALLLEAGLLTAAIPALLAGSAAGDCLVAAACGLQNAMASTYSGAIIRTTHVTGIVTDIGAELGGLLRGRRADAGKLRLLVALFSGFVGGTAVGATLFTHFGCETLAVPASATALGGLWQILAAPPADNDTHPT
jgi:uncharacterized membrane protein YoaK (UPF0700 family)